MKVKRKVGRPAFGETPKTHKLTLRLTEAEYNEITRVSVRVGYNKTETILKALKVYDDWIGY